MKQLYWVSACLAGLPCRYDGSSKPHPKIRQMYEAGLVSVICPESLSELPVPRPPAEQRAGRVCLKTGEDVTEEFRLGARRAFERVEGSGCKRFILKARSPSCGVDEVYDGTFTGCTKPGDGLFAAMLKQAGFEVQTEEDFTPEGGGA